MSWYSLLRQKSSPPKCDQETDKSGPLVILSVVPLIGRCRQWQSGHREREERANKEAAIRRNCTKCTPSARRGEQRGSAARPGTERGAVGNFFTALGSYGTRWPARRAARRWKTAKGENKDPPINRRGETPTGGQNSPGGRPPAGADLEDGRGREADGRGRAFPSGPSPSAHNRTGASGRAGRCLFARVELLPGCLG